MLHGTKKRYLGLKWVAPSLVIGLSACASSGAGSASEQAIDLQVATPAEAAGVFTTAQAERGADQFDQVCGECHVSSEFSDGIFVETWGSRSVYSFFRTVSQTMPDDNPGSLEPQVYYDVVAYVLSLNGHHQGPAELNAETTTIRDVKLTAPESDR